MSLQRISETWWRHTTATLLGVTLETYRRRRRDILMGCCGYVTLRRLADVRLRRLWVFYLRFVWEVVGTNSWDVILSSSWDVVTTFQWHVVETHHWEIHRDIISCFIWDVPATSLGCTERRCHDVLLPESQLSWLVFISIVKRNMVLQYIFWKNLNYKMRFVEVLVSLEFSK